MSIGRKLEVKHLDIEIGNLRKEIEASHYPTYVNMNNLNISTSEKNKIRNIMIRSRKLACKKNYGSKCPINLGENIS